LAHWRKVEVVALPLFAVAAAGALLGERLHQGGESVTNPHSQKERGDQGGVNPPEEFQGALICHFVAFSLARFTVSKGSQGAAEIAGTSHREASEEEWRRLCVGLVLISFRGLYRSLRCQSRGLRMATL
jgi:hypothetical protein